MGRPHTYDEATRTEALAQYAAGDSLRTVAARIGCDPSTVWTWLYGTHAVAGQYDTISRAQGAGPDEILLQRKQQASEMWWTAQEIAARRVANTLAALPEPETWQDARNLAIVGGVVSDKYLDAAVGRRGEVRVTVDGRQQTLNFGAMSVETLTWLQSLTPEERERVLTHASSTGQPISEGQTMIDGEVVSVAQNVSTEADAHAT